MIVLGIQINLGKGYIEKYLNKKADQGYRLISMTPFDLFVPLRLIIYKFQKVRDRHYIYKVTSLKEVNDEWKSFQDNYLENQDIHVYECCTEDKQVYQGQNDSHTLIIRECWLLGIYIILTSLIPMHYYGETILGFILHYSYIIIVLTMIIYGIINNKRNF